MPAIKGNQFWKLRNKHGRNTLFESPELLEKAAFEYFDWCDKHTWYKNEAIKSGQATGTIIKIPIARPYSLSGLCIYLGCGQGYFNHFKEKCGNEFLEVIERIENIIETQQFEGAVLGLFSASIIARKLGLNEQQYTTTGNPAILKIEVIAPEVGDELEKLRQNLG